jgi:nucleoside 2-deoxyribosyltransferase/predicted secreted protein
MFVLVCPCILNPSLRAEGITKPSDIEGFNQAIKRCEKFGIEIFPLPCPETLYLGSKRKPGTFLERLNTPDFTSMLDLLELKVHEVIDNRGDPLFILGVNSSPTCGVTTTYYGNPGNELPKRVGRGVFLARFPTIKAIDVLEFAKYRIYLAAPLFTEAERIFNTVIVELLKKNLFEVYVPQDIGDNSYKRDGIEHKRIFESNKKALEDADIIVAIIDGSDADSGTSWEMGYATALNKPIIALRTDFRRIGKHELVNLMLEQSATIVRNQSELLKKLKSPLLFDKAE